MKSKHILISAFIVMALAQLGAPLAMIARHENVLSNGTVYKFKTAPVDPDDPFRGKYVALSFEQRSVSCPEPEKLRRGETIYVRVKNGPDGFAVLGEASPNRPSEGDYFPAKVLYSHNKKVDITMPFDRYYLNEAAAPAAEEAYRKLNRRNGKNSPRDNTYVTIRIKDGAVVLEELYLDGVPIRDYLKAKP
ncbi:MAG: hypothetical protein A2X49_12010 [Lentisphaerae bacterium GWF2_52_8]|nr:MAG: hypothetical protein A2X49_12010 [Lentisphaerae bacterium GWF2_52_8]